MKMKNKKEDNFKKEQLQGIKRKLNGSKNKDNVVKKIIILV